MDVCELGTLDANFLRYGLHNALQKCPLVANREQWTVARINEKLSAPATRLQGLAVLEAFLPQCSDELFGEHAVSWMQQCLHALEAQGKSGLAPLAFHVLKTLVQMSSHFSELTKLISSSIVSKALEKIVATMDGDPAPALECLHALMTHYGGACGASKGLLEQALLRCVKNPERAAQAARCWALLVAVGGGGGQRANHKQQWAAMQLRLCNTLHHLLGRLLWQYRVLHVWTEDDDILPLPHVDDENDENPVSSVQKLTKQLCSVSKFLQAVLRGVFPVAKSVSVGEIMALVCRGLAVNCFSTPQKDAGKQVVLVTCMPDIHIAMLGVLEALIACCGRNLIPFGGIICDLVLQELRWTAVANPQYASERPFGPVRLAACRVLAAWLDVSKAASLVEKHAEGLVAALLQDVQSSKPAITLAAPTGKTKGSPKNAHKTEASSEVLPKRYKLRDGRANSEVCAAALEALRCVVRSAATFMPAKLHKVLQETVVALVLDIQRSSAAEELPVPYCVPGCRLGLYRLLEALAAWHHGERAPPTHFALAAFSRGQVDLDRQVSTFCTTALGHMEKVAHPACPSLLFPMAAYAEETKIAPRAEMPTSQLEVETSQNLGPDSFAGDKINSKASDKVELGGKDNVIELSDSEEVAVEAVSGESDNDFDDDGLRMTSDVSHAIVQSDQNSSSLSSSVLEPMSQDENDDVSGGNESALDKPGESSEDGILERNPKKTNRKAAATKRNLLRKEASCDPADVNLMEITSDEMVTAVGSGQLKEHEGDSDRDSDHCWTTEEAALVRHLIRDFESGDGASVDIQDGCEDDEGIREVAAGTDVSETKKRDSGTTSPKGSSVARKQAVSSKKIRKREASPPPASIGPQDKRQKTDNTLQVRDDENLQDHVGLETVIEGDIEDVGRVAPNNELEELVVDELNVSEECHKKNVEQPENLMSASKQTKKEITLIEVKEQEICSSAMRLTSGHSECIETNESKQVEQESDSIQECSTQFDTSKENCEQVERHDNNVKESDSVHDSPAQLEICDKNSEEIETHDDSQMESGSVQDCPVEIETYDESAEQFGRQNDSQEENDSVNDCPTQMENCDEISKQIEGQDDNRKEDVCVQNCPAQMETNENCEQVEGQDDSQKESDSTPDCQMEVDICGINVEQVNTQESEQSEKECNLVQRSPVQVEAGNVDSEQVRVQEGGQTEVESDGVQTCPAQAETRGENQEDVPVQESEQLEKDGGVAEASPSQVGTCEGDDCQGNGESSVHSEHEARDPRTEGEEASLQLKNTDGTLPEEQGSSTLHLGYENDSSIQQSQTV